MYDSILESESFLPCAALTNAKMTHLCWDNFDLCEETPSESGTTPSTHGIIIQEPPDEVDDITNVQSVIEKTKKRSSLYTPIVINPYFYNNFVEPAFNVLKLTFDDRTRETKVTKNNFL